MKKICWLIINSLLCFNIYALTYSEAKDKVTNYRNKKR